MRLRSTRLSSIAHRKNAIANVFSNAASAYSLRIPARSPYTGSLIKVRRSSDNSEADIGVAGAQLAKNRFFATDTLWTKGANVTISGGAMVCGAGVLTIAGQNMNLVTGRTYAITLFVNKTGFATVSRIRASTSNSLTAEGTNLTVLSAANPPNGLSIYSAQITADAPNLVFASSDANWSGSIYRVSVQDISPTVDDERWLNEQALSEHVGINSGFVSIWYDQSGNARNATQPIGVGQPRIYNAGIIETENERPAIRFTVGGQILNAADPLNGDNNSDISYNWVGTSFIGRGQDGFGGGWSLLSINIALIANGLVGYTYSNPASGDTRLNTVIVDQGASTTVAQKFWSGIGGTQSTFANKTLRDSTVGLTIGAQNGGTNLGTLLEIAVFPVALTNAARVALERSQGAAYGITTA